MITALRILGWVLLGLLGAFALTVVAYLLGSEWAHNILLAIDQYGNAVLGGDPDETISSRLGKWLTAGRVGVWDDIRYGVASVLCALLDLFDPDHCINSIDPNVGDRGLLP